MDQKPNEIRVVGARADKKMVVFYLESGEELIIKQGDHRLGDLLDVVIPITSRGETAVVSLQDFSVYAAFEQKSQGLTKFFRIAKDKVKGFFGGQTNTHETHIPEEGKQAILRAIAGEVMTEDEVIEHGKPIDPTDEIAENEVVVAVVTTPATETAPAKKAVIPGVQSLKPLINHAVKTNSVGVQAFLARCAQFIDKRQHSVDDLMRFLEKGDLPLADDGSIIAYKMLNTFRGDASGETFVDCHSGKIQQRVGSYVCVNENLVDLNRRNECSNGLHIARRGYLSSFGGDVCVLCKIDPEDVMVVPHNDPNKVRVKGYHILGKLSDEAKQLLKSGRAMTGEETALKMVYDAIKGNHIDRIERVQVNGQMGTNVVVTKLNHDRNKGRDGYEYAGSDLSKAAALDDETNVVGTVDPREINKKVTEEMAKVQQERQTGVPVSEGIIGNNPTMVILDDIHSGVEPEEDEDDVAGSGDDEADESTSPTYGDYQGEHPDEVREDARVTEEVIAMTPEEKQALNEMAPEITDRLAAKPEAPKASAIADLLLDFQTAPDGLQKNTAAQALVAFKKSKKKGWDKLGVDQKTADAIVLAASAGSGTKEEKQPEMVTPYVSKKDVEEAFPAKTEVVNNPPSEEGMKTIKRALKEAPKKEASSSGSKPKTKAEQAREIFNTGDMGALVAFKKSVKKGWTVLGFTDAEIKKIEGK